METNALKVMTAAVSRTLRSYMARIAGQHFGGRRDLYEAFGYPHAIGPENYLAAYQRGDIAARIIDAYPEATWREPPKVRARGAKEGGAFEVEVDKLAERLQLWAAMTRLDRMAGLGHYGVLFLGLDGGEQPAMPANGKRYGLFYLTPHGEASAQITNWDSDPRSPRYSRPLSYSLRTGVSWGGVGAGQQAITAHWSRTIHVAERALEDPSIGQPTLERIWNRVMDLEKMLGGSAEIYWQNAANLRAWIADKDAEWDPAEKAQMEAELQELTDQVRRDVRLRGVTPHSLAADPKSEAAATIIDKLLDFLAGGTGIPKRILIGSERGELSSEQDENNWSARVTERRERHAGPFMVRPFIDRCIALGVLSDPGEYDVIWPESDTLGEEKRALVAKTQAEAAAAYVGTPGTDMVVTPEEFRRSLGLPAQPEEGVLAEEPGTAGVPQPEPPAPGAGGVGLDDDPQAVAAFNRHLVLIDNAAPRTLYVRRQVLNWREIAKWAKEQGFATTVGDDMHVTIAHSSAAVDWLKISPDWVQKPGDLSGELDIAAGGPRVVEELGNKGAVVLSFASNDLRWRHDAIRDAGASWDWDGYQPHVTITYKRGDVDLAKVKPYTGPIKLGPELFEELKEGHADGLVENARKPAEFAPA